MNISILFGEIIIKTFKRRVMANKVVITGINTSNLPKLSGEEIDELLKKLKQGDELAKELFIVANMRLVLSVVQRFGGKGDKADDMFQVGCVGLMKAIDNFDTTLGVRFSTYAVPMIIGEIRRFLRDNNSVRVSRSLRDVAYKTLQAKEVLSKDRFSEPTLDEISAYLDIPVKTINFALDAISETVSLSDPVYNDGSEGVEVQDQIADYKDGDESLYEKIALKDAIKKLAPREREILMLRYYIGKTQVEVSEEVGISQAQVSRLEKNALEQIKNKI